MSSIRSWWRKKERAVLQGLSVDAAALTEVADTAQRLSLVVQVDVQYPQLVEEEGTAQIQQSGLLTLDVQPFPQIQVQPLEFHCTE